MKRVLLASVFKPCTDDDMYGRKENICELFHNQLTRYQGVFSPRQHIPSIGLYLIAANIGAPATVLDFPTLDAFAREAATGYDYVGISSIQANIHKVQAMAGVVREVSPRSRIVLGGYIASMDNVGHLLDADHICEGEGIRFMRDLLREPPAFEFRHPVVVSTLREFMGVPVEKIARLMGVLGRPLTTLTSFLVTGLGCTNGCEFCSTSHFFGCAHIPFMRTGREIFNEMQRQESLHGLGRFCFIGDDNFFIGKSRAEDLHRCVTSSGRMFNIGLVFSSLNFLRHYEPRFIAEMGVDKVWIGLESSLFPFGKNQGMDIAGYFQELKRYGIKIFLSSILCMDGHTAENIREDIDRHIALKPTYSQFALLSVAEGTPLHARLKKEKRMLHSVPYEDRHGFKVIWFSHPSFTVPASEKIQREAYEREFLVLGPSFAREIEVNVRSYETLHDSDSPLLRQKAERFRREMPMYAVLLRASEALAPTESMRSDLRALRVEVEGRIGRTGTVRRAEALVLALFGKAREFRTRYFGDGIEPRTVMARFNNHRLS